MNSLTGEITELSFEPRAGSARPVSYSFDPETGIFSARFGGAPEDAAPGTIELADRGGGIILLQQEDGALSAVEVVIWPYTDRDVELDLPEATMTGTLIPSLPNGELECDALASIGRDNTLLYLELGDDEAAATVAVGESVSLDLDATMSLSGIWFSDLPAGIGAEIGQF